MNEHIEQGSPEWLEYRNGRVTASRLNDVMAKGKGGAPSTTRRNYLTELVLERLTGRSAERNFKSAAMEQGNEREDQARGLYTMTTGRAVETCGIFQHPRIEMAAASPDGLIGTDGGLEIKCPIPATHLDTMQGASIDTGYMRQMQWGMACTGRLWWDFVSFNPDFPDEMQIHIRRVPRDPAMIVEIEAEVQRFLSEVSDTAARLRAQFSGGGF